MNAALGVRTENATASSIHSDSSFAYRDQEPTPVSNGKGIFTFEKVDEFDKTRIGAWMLASEYDAAGSLDASLTAMDMSQESPPVCVCANNHGLFDFGQRKNSGVWRSTRKCFSNGRDPVSATREKRAK
jgi:hypothetical protein